MLDEAVGWTETRRNLNEAPRVGPKKTCYSGLTPCFAAREGFPYSTGTMVVLDHRDGDVKAVIAENELKVQTESTPPMEVLASASFTTVPRKLRCSYGTDYWVLFHDQHQSLLLRRAPRQTFTEPPPNGVMR